MAEVVAVVGVAAAAVQFTEIGCKAISHASTLLSRLKDAPQCLQRTLAQVQQLLHLAELVVDRNMLQSSKDSMHVPSGQLMANPRRLTLAWQKQAWDNCTAQARQLELILRSMTEETSDSKAQRIWKRILTVKREENIWQIAEEIERQKSTLNIWFGQECLDSIRDLNQDMVKIHEKQQMCLFDEIRAIKSEIHLLAHDRATALQRKPKVKSNKTTKSRLIKALPTCETTISSSPCNDTKIPYLPAQQPCWCSMQDWRVSMHFLGCKMLLYHRKTAREGCPMHSPMPNGSETNLRWRRNMYSSPGTVEFVASINWVYAFPSIGMSLRPEARVKFLPMESFFRRIYNKRLYRFETEEGPHGPIRYGRFISEDQQSYILSVAKNVLLKSFRDGSAAPYLVNRDGHSLLHLQMIYLNDRNATFVARMIRLLLSFGVPADLENDQFLTAQQYAAVELAWMAQYKSRPVSVDHDLQESPFNHELLEWTPRVIAPSYRSAHEILDSVIRWPDSASDLGYSQICDIVIRRSLTDLDDFTRNPVNQNRARGNYITPLHFATTARWSQGVEFLLAHGEDRYAKDLWGYSPIEVAIRSDCVPILEILLRDNGTTHTVVQDCLLPHALPMTILRALTSSNEELQDILVKTLARDQLLLGSIRPYHELCLGIGIGEDRNGAEKLFVAGFHDIEEYDEEGMSPLLFACQRGHQGMISFLLERGAAPDRSHRDARLMPGHYLIYHKGESFSTPRVQGLGDVEFQLAQDTKLLQVAFEAAPTVESICRCCPDGYSPVQSMYKLIEEGSLPLKIRNCRKMIERLCLCEEDTNMKWKLFVRMEVFTRLELTHTCIRQFPTIRKFPEEDRLDIEEEELELYEELETIMEHYDDQRASFAGPVANFVIYFLNALDQSLKPPQTLKAWFPTHDDGSDILGPGINEYHGWTNSRGEIVWDGHVEEVRETYILRSLFEDE